MALKKFLVLAEITKDVELRVFAKNETQAFSKAKKSWRKKHNVKLKDFNPFPSIYEL